jgi:hypothetical protein
MKRVKLLSGLISILVAVACLVSVPALSGENPWDADDGGQGGTGSPLDSTLLDAGMLSAQSQGQSTPVIEDQNPGWFDRAIIRVSSFIINNFTLRTAKKSQIVRSAN